ncbi:MAG: hypothetical protein PHQ98_03565 [Candidatus ainarchaeum sp.]|nr:hypothetical protein [Candidatus ainarchaeum sp.]
MLIKLKIGLFETSCTNSLVVDIVSKFPGLTSVQIHNLIKKTEYKRISYQGIFKTLSNLVDIHVLDKKNKLYYINQIWISQLKKYVRNVEKNKNFGKTLVFVLNESNQ